MSTVKPLCGDWYMRIPENWTTRQHHAAPMFFKLAGQLGLHVKVAATKTQEDKIGYQLTSHSGQARVVCVIFSNGENTCKYENVPCVCVLACAGLFCCIIYYVTHTLGAQLTLHRHHHSNYWCTRFIGYIYHVGGATVAWWQRVCLKPQGPEFDTRLPLGRLLSQITAHSCLSMCLLGLHFNRKL